MFLFGYFSDDKSLYSEKTSTPKEDVYIFEESSPPSPIFHSLLPARKTLNFDNMGNTLVQDSSFQQDSSDVSIPKSLSQSSTPAFSLTNSATNSSSETPTPKRKTKRKNPLIDSEFKPNKRLRHDKIWLQNIDKISKNTNKEFCNKRGKLQPSREMKPACKDSCFLNCATNISEGQRKEQFEAFWKIENHDDKIDFLSRCMTITKKKTQYDEHLPPTREYSCNYEFVIDLKKIRVCKTMFMNTFSISNGMLKTVVKKFSKGPNFSPDKRGKHQNRGNKVQESTINTIIEHVNLFERKEAHYIRKDSKKEYLAEEGLNKTQLHKKYEEWVREAHPEVKPASRRQYIDIFDSKFSIGFFVPKKDQCNFCVSWNLSEKNPEERAKLEKGYQEHVRNKIKCRELKDADKIIAKNLKQNPHLCMAVFDLQKTLNIPKAETNILYYKRKFSMYNCTVYDIGRKKGYCYVWREDVGKKGSNEVASFVLDFIKRKVEDNISEFIFYADNCGGQNKNRFVICMLIFASMMFKLKITYRFLECGHTQNEGDSMHSVIENASKNRTIYTPDDWIRIMKHAKQENPYDVTEVIQDQIFDFKFFVDKINTKVDINNKKIPWSKIREIYVTHEAENKLFYKREFKDDFQEIDLNFKISVPFKFEECELKRAYTENLGIPAPKLKDLRSLCKLGKDMVIPQEFHYFYASLHERVKPIPSDDVEDENPELLEFVPEENF